MRDLRKAARERDGKKAEKAKGEKGCRGFDSQYMATYIHTHRHRRRRQKTRNTEHSVVF